MLASSVLQRHQESNADYLRETESGGGAAARALHDRLVAYAHLVAGDPESRSGVCSEHSYARVRECAGLGAELRELLSAAPPPPPPPAPLDVEYVSGAPPALHLACDVDHDCEDGDGNNYFEEEDAWEEHVVQLAPSATHARLVRVAIDALRELRLSRLASAAGVRACGAVLRREQARAAARRLRRELAPLWAGGRVAAWLHSAMVGALPQHQRALYDEMLTELRRSVPRLAERLSPHLPAVPPDPLEPADAGEACGGDALLVWISIAGSEADARWLRHLRPLLPTREVRAALPAERRLAPERWCAAVTTTVRSQLDDVLADIGSRFVVLGGSGAGAALAAGAAAAGARPRGLLLLSPPLLTAEGPRDDPDDILHELRIPMLVVCGGGGAACGRSAAAETSARGGRGARRLLVLGGADDALRVPAALRRRLRLPQRALDAAVADECARWAGELARERRERQERGDRHTPGSELAEEACSPPPAHAALPVRHTGTRVVSRALGGTPLALPPPLGTRRAPVAPATPAALEAADILQLPIVFADDEPPAFAPPGATADDGEAPTARSGARGKLTRVIVARRARAGPARPRVPRPSP